MQVVQNYRMVVEKRPHHVSRQGERHPESIAIVIVCYVFAPVEQWRRGLSRIGFAIVILIDGPVAPIYLKRGCDHYDDVLANCIDERAVFNRKPIGKLHQHLRRASLGRVNRTRRPVQRLPFPDQLLGFGVVDLARISQPRRDFFVAIKLGDIGFVGDDHEHLFLAIF